MQEPTRRRRRVRHVPEQTPEPTALTADVSDEVAQSVVEPPEGDTTPAERGLRGLVGGGSSQVKPPAALRARDAARPRDEDIARAEAELVIVRRNWTPRD